jgi:hypothetical protein
MASSFGGGATDPSAWHARHVSASLESAGLAATATTRRNRQIAVLCLGKEAELWETIDNSRISIKTISSFTVL